MRKVITDLHEFKNFIRLVLFFFLTPVLILCTGLFESANAIEMDWKWPVKIERILSSSFGEWRGHRFHSGIDLKTRQQTGVRVYAVERGFVCRIKISRRGYGRVLYIQHPDKTVSVYAHLKVFAPEIESFIQKKLKKKKSKYIDLYCKSNWLPIKKRDYIALSGETGSGPPHLHFELRDTMSIPVSPSLYGYRVSDNKPPEIKKVFIKPLKEIYASENSSYKDNSLFDREIQSIFLKKQSKGVYKPSNPEIRIVSGPFYLQTVCLDRADKANNRMSPVSIRLVLNNKDIFISRMERFNYSENFKGGIVHDLKKPAFSSGGLCYNLAYLPGYPDCFKNSKIVQDFNKQKQTFYKRQLWSDYLTPVAPGIIVPEMLKPGKNRFEIYATDPNENISKAEFFVIFNRLPSLKAGLVSESKSLISLHVFDPDINMVANNNRKKLITTSDNNHPRRYLSSESMVKEFQFQPIFYNFNHRKYHPGIKREHTNKWITLTDEFINSGTSLGVKQFRVQDAVSCLQALTSENKNMLLSQLRGLRIRCKDEYGFSNIENIFFSDKSTEKAFKKIQRTLISNVMSNNALNFKRSYPFLKAKISIPLSSFAQHSTGKYKKYPSDLYLEVLKSCELIVFNVDPKKAINVTKDKNITKLREIMNIEFLSESDLSYLMDNNVWSKTGLINYGDNQNLKKHSTVFGASLAMDKFKGPALFPLFLNIEKGFIFNPFFNYNKTVSSDNNKEYFYFEPISEDGKSINSYDDIFNLFFPEKGLFQKQYFSINKQKNIKLGTQNNKKKSPSVITGVKGLFALSDIYSPMPWGITFQKNASISMVVPDQSLRKRCLPNIDISGLSEKAFCKKLGIYTGRSGKWGHAGGTLKDKVITCSTRAFSKNYILIYDNAKPSATSVKLKKVMANKRPEKNLYNITAILRDKGEGIDYTKIKIIINKIEYMGDFDPDKALWKSSNIKISASEMDQTPKIVFIVGDRAGNFLQKTGFIDKRGVHLN